MPGTDANPEAILLGDSFTFGFGLKDDKTFASSCCTTLHPPCAKVGVAGRGTSRRPGRLNRFLDELGWRPRELKLFFLGTSASFSSGNDFVDNV